ncbi:MAG TPA: hypothetical protein PK385_04470 [Spirochaetota bacterium]|nr:hypothetical protein [Spirochaetota bacterium]HOS33181.1 hypothetical protein [Spirochaetota bacterium]HOS55292.1 hypothetical protein [Spirochaetota bacterium]HPK61597.1 hypothetical protein [Spirochaetota bacterium]HQF77833.1 hypothetical protein [Spirochaetota bacterium]
MGVARAGYSVKVLRVILGIFFIFLGIAGVSPDIGEGSFFQLSRNHNDLEVIFGIVEIICGALLLLGLFLFLGTNVVKFAGVVVLIFWMIRIILTRFVWGINFISNGNINVINMLEWFLYLSCELLIFTAIWIVIQRYD